MSDKGRYTVGPFWLDTIKNSPNWYIHWYNPNSGKVERRSTGSSAFQAAVEKITEHHARHVSDATEPEGMTVAQVATKYWLEHGQKIINKGQTQTSLARLTEFVAWAEQKNRVPINMPASEWTKETTRLFVQWIYDNPHHTKSGIPRPVTVATVNRCLSDCRAAIRYCLDRPPIIKLLPTPPKTGKKKAKLSLDQMAALFDYAFETEDRRHLQAYLVAAVTTLARPSSILDINSEPERGQVDWDYRLLYLNPDDREQTKKFRPTLPIHDALLPWLQDADGFLVQYKGEPVANMRATFNRAKKALGWPMVRDWNIKMLRHTVSTYLRSKGIPWQDIQGYMGHAMPGETDEYAEFEPEFMAAVHAAITDYLAEIHSRMKVQNTQVSRKLKGNVVSLENKKIGKSGS